MMVDGARRGLADLGVGGWGVDDSGAVWFGFGGLCGDGEEGSVLLGF